jgi:hypothetical protein
MWITDSEAGGNGEGVTGSTETTRHSDRLAR